MATIDSYVAHSRIDPISSRARRRRLWTGVAASVGLAALAGLGLSGGVGTPPPAKFEARVAADTAPYPENQDDERIAAFQQSVAISHLTAIAPAPIAAARTVPPAPKPPRAQRAAPAMARKNVSAPFPPPRPTGLETVAGAALGPPAFVPLPVGPLSEPKTPVLTEIVHRIGQVPDRAVALATDVADRLLSLRTRVGF